MKRSALISIFAIASIALASQASAIEVFLGTPSSTAVALNDTFTITYLLDTEGETQITSIFVSVFADPTLFEFVSGSSPGLILFNASSGEFLSRVSQPVIGFGDPPGQVRAANFATTNAAGSGVSSTNQIMSTLTFMAVGNGVGTIQAVVVNNDDAVTVAQVAVTDLVTTVDSVPITVPEPGAAALSLIAIGTVALIRRRTVSA